MTYSTIEYRVDKGVGWLTLNRPDRMNAINSTLYDEFCAALAQAGADDTLRVLVLTGAGERAFCAGADLQARGEERPMNAARVSERNIYPERSLNGALMGFDKPLIAAVNGVAVGGGLTMALASDIIIASEKARFGTAHAKLAMPLLDILGYLLPRRIGPGRASELAFTGRIIDADEALRIGIADRVVPAAELATVARALADEIARTAPLSLHFSKQAIRRYSPESYQDYVLYERYIFNTCFNSEDAKEAIRARREGRPPVYKGR